MRFASETRLRSVFADILTTVLATSSVLVAGCGGGTTTDVTNTSGGTGGTGTESASLCTGGPELGTLLATMHTTPALDGAEYRNESAFPGATSYPPVSPDPTTTSDGWIGTIGDKVGTLCSGAKDVAACQAKVDGFRVLPSTVEACTAQYGSVPYYDGSQCHASYILYTRGDQVGVARTNDETKALISTIDTIGEAMWVAQTTAQYTTSCGSYPSAGLPESSYRRLANGNWELADLTTNVCNEPIHRVTVQVDYAGAMTVTSDVISAETAPCAVAGRRPAGLQKNVLGPRGDEIGEHFASMAQLEAASVIAFRRLQRHLAAHGAPPELLARVRKAAHDEIRHARSTSALARKYGVTPTAPKITAETSAPSLFALAVENAREGCVRETYGALVAHAQARAATDLDVRRAMLGIAEEETEHAALSWDIAAWIESQLDARSRQLLARERRDALRVLATELAEPVPAHVSAASGIPSSRDALRMLDGLATTLIAA